MAHLNSRQILEKSWNVKFHENPSIGSRVPCGQTDGHETNSSFLQFCKSASKRCLDPRKMCGVREWNLNKGNMWRTVVYHGVKGLVEFESAKKGVFCTMIESILSCGWELWALVCELKGKKLSTDVDFWRRIARIDYYEMKASEKKWG